jgi:hypothetical protein
MMESKNLFQHEPLDHTIQSLRLVHLLPEKAEVGLLGTIQCTITHMTTAARYVCLSYTWDKPYERSHGLHSDGLILINGKEKYVRGNLWNFLYTMWSSAARDDAVFDPNVGYWIDALCIDQDNTEERNHQVGQMGSIFSRAEFVHVWLGACKEENHIRNLLHGGRGRGMDFDWKELVYQQVSLFDRCIFNNTYWSRAWIVQEVVLAKRVEVSLGAQRVPFSVFMQKLQGARHARNGIKHFEQFANRFKDITELCNNPLAELLHHFQDKDCGHVQDRIISLLALCNDSADVPVRYDIEKTELAYQILKSRQRTTCPCTAFIVARALALGTPEPPTTVPTTEAFLCFNFVDVWVQGRLLVDMNNRPTVRFLYGNKTQHPTAQCPPYWSEDPWLATPWATSPDCEDFHRLHSCERLNQWLWRFYTEIIDFALSDYTATARSKGHSPPVRLCDLIGRVETELREFGEPGQSSWHEMLRPLEIHETDTNENIVTLRVSLNSLPQVIVNEDNICSWSAADNSSEDDSSEEDSSEDDSWWHEDACIENIRVTLEPCHNPGAVSERLREDNIDIGYRGRNHW